MSKGQFHGVLQSWAVIRSDRASRSGGRQTESAHCPTGADNFAGARWFIDPAIRLVPVTSIREWLEDEQQGRLIGSLRYMRSVASSLESCAPTEADQSAFGDQLESIVQSAHDIMAMQER